MSNLIELAERCEAYVVGPDHDPVLCDDIHAVLPEPKCIQPPNYCSSIDAAMTLVPEGMDFGCGRGIDTELGPNKAVCHAWVGEGEGDLVFAGSVALALCAAALYARAARETADA